MQEVLAELELKSGLKNLGLEQTDVLERVLVDLHSLVESGVMAVEAIKCSDSFGLGKTLIVKVDVVVMAVRKSSEDAVVLTQTKVAA